MTANRQWLNKNDTQDIVSIQNLRSITDGEYLKERTVGS